MSRHTEPLTLRDDDVQAFFDVPFRVYARTSPYVSPLKSDLRRALDVRQNPLFGTIGRGKRRVITAHRGGVPVGRIVAHVHGASNELHNERRSSFGFFDCADDSEVARALLDEAAAFGRSEGCDRLVGNFNLTAMQQSRVLTEGFDAVPYSDMHYNPPHIPRLLEENGFERTFPASTFELDLHRFDPETLRTSTITQRLQDPALRWETLHTRHFDRVLEHIRLVLNDGFRHNPMFVPLASEEMFFQAKDLSHVLDTRITALVHDAEGPAGVVLCIPDLNPMLRRMRSRLTILAPWHLLMHRIRRHRAVIIFYSVAQRRQGQGLNGAMLYRVTQALQRHGYRALGITWIADVNAASLRQMERVGAKRLHGLHLFSKRIAGA